MAGVRLVHSFGLVALASGLVGGAHAQSVGTAYDMSRMLAAPHPFARSADPRPSLAVPASRPAPRIVPAASTAPSPVRPAPTPTPTALPVAAPEPERSGGVWRIEYGNEDRSLAADIFDPIFGEGPDDGGLTWGWRFSYTPNATHDWVNWLRRHLFWVDGTARINTSYAVELDAMTPNSAADPAGNPARPHVGYLGLGTRLGIHKMLGARQQRLDTLDLLAGLLGPASGAKSFHNLQHDVIGSDADGWNQIESEPFINVGYETGRRLFLRERGAMLNAEVHPHAGLTVGNAFTYANLGLNVRVGGNLMRDLGAPRLRTLLSGETFPETGSYWAWNLFFGLEGRAVAHDVTLDGNAFQDSPSVDKKNFVYDLQMGFEGGYGANRLSLVNVYRSREFEDQLETIQFIRIALSVGF